MVKLIDETQRISGCKHLKKLQYKFCKMLGSFNYSMDSMYCMYFYFYLFIIILDFSSTCQIKDLILFV